jgi:hypothetical protein
MQVSGYGDFKQQTNKQTNVIYRCILAMTTMTKNQETKLEQLLFLSKSTIRHDQR